MWYDSSQGKHRPHPLYVSILITTVDEVGRFEELLRVLADLAEENVEDDVPIIVEGRHDLESLRKLGCQGRILVLHSGETLFGFCESVGREARRAILLVDWDRKGAILHDSVGRGLEAVGVKVNDRYRGELKRWINAQTKDIESIAPYVERGRRKFKV